MTSRSYATITFQCVGYYVNVLYIVYDSMSMYCDVFVLVARSMKHVLIGVDTLFTFYSKAIGVEQKIHRWYALSQADEQIADFPANPHGLFTLAVYLRLGQLNKYVGKCVDDTLTRIQRSMRECMHGNLLTYSL